MIHDLVYLGFGIFALYVMASRVRIDRLVRAGTPVDRSSARGCSSRCGHRRHEPTAASAGSTCDVIYLQPSEMFKLFTVLFVAWLVEHHHDELGQLACSWRSGPVPVTFGCALILLEPDIGTCRWWPSSRFAMLACGGALAEDDRGDRHPRLAGFGAYMKSKPYSAARFLSFLHPNAQLQGNGYQLLQSRIGLGAGGVGGLGLGHSREKWGLLPNPHTDFIFTIIGEELGLIGTLLVIALFVAFLFAAVRIAQKCTNDGLPIGGRGHHDVDRRRGGDQHRVGRGLVGRDGDPPAVLLLRRHGVDHRTGRGRAAVQHRARPQPISGDVTIRARASPTSADPGPSKSRPRPAPRSRSTNDPRRTR
jgi:hypothetical protein